MACLLVWAYGVRLQRPIVLIVENVTRFPVKLLVSLLGDLYALEWVHLEAADFGAACRRKRLYCVLTLRRVAHLSRPLSELLDSLRGLFTERRSWESLFCLDRVDDGMSKPVLDRAAGYAKLFSGASGIYDLDQLPYGRPRHAKDGQPLFTLTAHTRLAWAPAEARCLRRNELALAMGLPSCTAVGSVYGSPVLDFEGLSRSKCGRLVGNGMSVPCVGSVLAWCAAWVEPSAGPLPRSVTPAGPSDGERGPRLSDRSGTEDVHNSKSCDGRFSASCSESPDLHGAQPFDNRSNNLDLCDAQPSDNGCPAWSLLGLLSGIILDARGIFEDYWSVESPPAEGRLRDVFPLPLPLTLDSMGMQGIDKCDASNAVLFARAMVVALRYGCRESDAIHGSPAEADDCSVDMFRDPWHAHHGVRPSITHAGAF